MNPSLLDIRPEVATALREGRPVVALESTLIAHGLPRPLNLDTARAAEAAVRAEGAVPATIAVLQGRPTVGLSDGEIAELAFADGVLKASRRDLATAVAQKKTAATTVAATIFLAYQAGIRVFATGGIGGAHRPFSPLPAGERGGGEGWDISADLVELARIPVAVVCAGAKSILDIPRTLEILETLSVPVIGYATDDFPAFYLRSSGERVSARIDTPAEGAAYLAAHWALDGGGVVIAQPLPAEAALTPDEFVTALERAEQQASAANIRGNALTPFLLARLAEATVGRTLRANQALIVANARLAAQLAAALVKGGPA